MKFAVIADIHGNSAALDAVLDDVARAGIRDIVNLGDSLSGPLDPAGTADRLLGLDLPTVAGNHDRYLIDRPLSAMGRWESWTAPELAPRHFDWLRALPAGLDWNGVRLCHGSPASDEENWLDHRGENNRMQVSSLSRIEALAAGSGAALTLCAHTHVARAVRVSGGRMVLNPGSVGCPAYADTRTEVPIILETGSPDARYAVLERRGGYWQAALCAVPYDAAAMIERANAAGAPDWAAALATGWIPR